MNNSGKLKELIQKIAMNVIEGAALPDISYAELISIEPLQFWVNSEMTLSGVHIVTPKYLVFTKDDLGKKFVFMKNQGGQTYFLLYEAAPQGHNGIPYKWSGEIVKADLKGKCPTGDVKVTHGTIELAIHERGEN